MFVNITGVIAISKSSRDNLYNYCSYFNYTLYGFLYTYSCNSAGEL